MLNLFNFKSFRQVSIRKAKEEEKEEEEEEEEEEDERGRRRRRTQVKKKGTCRDIKRTEPGVRGRGKGEGWVCVKEGWERRIIKDRWIQGGREGGENDRRRRFISPPVPCDPWMRNG